MPRTLILPLLICIVSATSTTAEQKAQGPVVTMETTLGRVVVELYPDKAPKTVENFLHYVRSGYYDGTIFHRIIPFFMIQGGVLTPNLKIKGERRDPIANEAENGLKNVRGSLSMARTSHPHSARAQFFINVVDNEILDFKSTSAEDWGYCVFGRVIEGMSVVESLSQVPTIRRAGYAHLPLKPVVIDKVWVR